MRETGEVGRAQVKECDPVQEVVDHGQEDPWHPAFECIGQDRIRCDVDGPKGQKKRYRALERVGKIDPERGQSCLFVMRLQAAAPQFLGKLNWRAEGVNQAKGLK